MAGPVGGMRKHPNGRVDQLEDRYLGMVEAPSSNLGTSTSLMQSVSNEVGRVTTAITHFITLVVGSARPLPFTTLTSTQWTVLPNSIKLRPL